MADESPIVPKEVVEDQARNFEKILENVAPELTRSVSRKRREEIARLLSATFVSIRVRSGPLPSGEELEEYNQLIPNGADRVMTMAENQSAHRIEIEKIAVKSQQKQGSRGQIFAFVIAVLAIVASVYVTLIGHPVTGGIIGGSTVVSLVTVFVTGRLTQRHDLKRKSAQ